ncbi:MAG: DNA-binding protein [Desulfobacterales bacterium SG8_35]|jgi:integration host factor subunit alpha|nr:MAG: DNA-binding protein [Desulfobacterales bacterium SG8_35]
MSFTKAELISRVHSSASNFNKAQARQAVESILCILKTCLENGDDVLLSRFGKFNVKVKPARKGRNPQTGEPVILEARRVVTFKPSGILQKKVNGK